VVFTPPYPFTRRGTSVLSGRSPGSCSLHPCLPGFVASGL